MMYEALHSKLKIEEDEPYKQTKKKKKKQQQKTKTEANSGLNEHRKRIKLWFYWSQNFKIFGCPIFRF